MNLETLRREIDQIDKQLLTLLNTRMGLVKKVGLIKSKEKSKVYRPEREKFILDKLDGMNDGPLTKSAIEAIFLEIFSISRNFELPERIAFLGPEGSFTHQVAESRFGVVSDYFSLASIRSVFETVSMERASFGVVPIENNQEGVVNETIDYLAKSDLKIVAEVPMPIHFSFASLAENLGEIQIIYSKDIAFRQCKQFIEDSFGKNVELIPVNSTSKGVKIALEDKSSAAICSHIAAKQFQLPILFENIEDSKDNYTRFIILGKNFINHPSGNDKTTLFARPSDSDKPGSLASFLQDFHNANINLTKIESYPAKKGRNFNYWFFVDIDGHFEDAHVKKVLEKHRKEVTLLGSYVKLC